MKQLAVVAEMRGEAVRGTYYFGLVGRLDVAVLDGLPVDAPEEAVVFDVALTVRPTAQARRRVFQQQLKAVHRVSISQNYGVVMEGASVN